MFKSITFNNVESGDQVKITMVKGGRYYLYVGKPNAWFNIAVSRQDAAREWLRMYISHPNKFKFAKLVLDY
ncbi:MAG: hypothetical protein M0R51_10980 [Clostridia bacterium]|nr:hypothetical protein [Clostridia bacterium]